MAAWLTALKLVPWVDVIEATPKIVQAARKLLGARRQKNASPPIATGLEGMPLADSTAAQLQARIAALETEQQASAQVIESLAENNAQLVRAIESLRVTVTWLVRALIVVSISTTVVGGYLLNQ